MLKKLKLAVIAFLLPLVAFAQSYPSPTFNNVTVSGTLTANGTIAGTGTLGVPNGGTGATTASAALANLGGMPIAGGNFTGAAGISFDQNNATRFTVSNQSSGASALTGLDFESFGGSWKIDVPQSATFVNPLIFKFGTTEVARLSPTGAALQVTGGASFTVRPTFNGATPWDSANLNFATPPAIGGTTPAAGSFTNLTATGTLTGFPGRLINVQVFTASGTYTATTGTHSVIVEVQAAGGGSGGVAATAAGQSAVSFPGGSGAYAKVWITSGFSGSTVTIGSAGTAGTAGANAGGNGGTTAFGTFVSCPGGSGGSGGSASSSATVVGYGASSANPTISGVAATILSLAGAANPAPGIILTPGAAAASSSGGSSILGLGGQGRGGTNVGAAGAGYGSGAGGSVNNASASAAAGAAGGGAIVIVYEFS
jgi:hypothetical protein